LTSRPAGAPHPDADAPPIPPWIALAVAVAAIAWAAPLVRLATAPALAVSAWRLLFSMAFIGGVLVLRRGSGLPRLSAGEWGLAVAAGLMLAGHFWSWIASVDLTTVASAVILVSLQPFLVALLSAAFLDERPTRLQWAGIGVAVAGAGVVGWGDLALGGTALLGDALAFLAAWLVSGYYIVGRRLRRTMDLWSYVAVVYGVAAVALAGAVALSPGVPFTGYPRGDWLVFLALAAGPMMLGHTGVNYAIRYVPAYVANLAILGEPLLATVIAWALPAIREVPPARTLAGAVLILGGIVLGSGWLEGGRGRDAPS
jgi:drug/metabolite transporter (DMT)-like permease